jgi:DNA-nicking Smr family endonuclease
MAIKPKVAPPRQRPAGPPALSPIMRKERQKLVRKHETIDERIDLHGMTQTEAYTALRSLLQRSQANGAKFVLVITGKGLPNPAINERGVLRRQVPLWLALPEFRRYVVGFDVAHPGHGGEGALYVRLRKVMR